MKSEAIQFSPFVAETRVTPPTGAGTRWRVGQLMKAMEQQLKKDVMAYARDRVAILSRDPGLEKPIDARGFSFSYAHKGGALPYKQTISKEAVQRIALEVGRRLQKLGHDSTVSTDSDDPGTSISVHIKSVGVSGRL